VSMPATNAVETALPVWHFYVTPGDALHSDINNYGAKHCLIRQFLFDPIDR